jgi:hypothetical protein
VSEHGYVIDPDAPVCGALSPLTGLRCQKPPGHMAGRKGELHAAPGHYPRDEDADGAVDDDKVQHLEWGGQVR